jgi:hypothetical protein
MNIAIVIGISDYQHTDSLPASKYDSKLVFNL